MLRLALLASSLTIAACSSDSEGGVAGGGAGGGSGSGGVAGGSAGSSGSSGSSGTGGSAGTGGSSGTGQFDGGSFQPIPARTLPGLESITFYERTGGTEPTAYTFTVNGPELTVRESDPLMMADSDITGATGEFYDVYYSDEDGTFNIDGSYLTISGVFSQAAPAGGGLNLAEIGLNFSDNSTEFGNYLASYVTLGDNKDEMRVEACIDGDLQTHTSMGNTLGASERLRLTLGFESTSGPPQ